MSDQPSIAPDAGALRQQAEQRLREQQRPAQPPLDLNDTRALVHELQVHQIELEMQNEELRRAQAALDAARTRYFDLYDQAPVGYVTVSEKGLILEANLNAAALLGATRAALVQQPLTQFIFKEDQEIYYRHRQQLWAADSPQTCELRMVQLGGTIIWARLESASTPDADGAPVCRVVLSDITERQRMVARLQASEERYRTILQTTMDGFWLVDAQGRLLEVNETYCGMTGYSKPELLAMRIPDLEAGEAANDIASHLQKVTARGEDRFESRHRRKDGTVFEVEVSVQYRPTEGGRCVAFLRDISARKAAERALQLSETRLKLAQQAGRIGTFERNLQTGETIWSEELEALYGLPPGGFEGTYASWQQRVLPADRPAVQKELARAVAQHGDFQVEYRVLWPDGTIHWLAAAGKVVADERGEPARTFGTTLDITGRKVAEAALRQAHDELERRVQERTADLNQTVAALQAEIAQRQQAEAALRDSEARYRTLFEAAPVGIGISNHRGEVMACNRRLAEMAGVTAEEFCARPAASFYAAPAQRRRLLAEIRRTGQVAEREEALQRPDGAKLVGRLQMNEIQMDRERVLLTLVQDITRQKEAEKRVECVRGLLELFAAKSSLKEYLSAVVKHLRDWCGCRAVGVRLLDASGRIPFVAHVGLSGPFLAREKEVSLLTGNCACVRIVMGRARPEDVPCTSGSGSFFCNHTSQFAAHLPAAPTPRSAIACLSAGYESLAHAALRYRGEIIGTIQLADARAGQFPAETIAFIESVAPLIGEAIHRFQVETSLQESEARFRTLFERHGSVMLLLDPQSGALVDANPAAADFYGHSRDALRTMNVADLNALPPATQAAYGCLTLRSQRALSVFPHRLASGEIRTVEVHSSPISIQGRRLLFLIIHDITERMLLEKQVLEISEQERQRVGQDLHDTLGGRLTGTALLVKALAQGLARRGLPEAALAEEVVQSINESIADTRAIARGLCPVELSVTGLPGGLSELAHETQRQSGVACHFQADPQIQVRDLHVATHLFQIAREAVTNALRHSHAKQINLRLTGNADQVSLEIRDGGQGLPRRPKPTLGLGLRTMHYRARAIGAHLNIRSSSQGTVVTCRLPAGGAAFTRPMTNDKSMANDE